MFKYLKTKLRNLFRKLGLIELDDRGGAIQIRYLTKHWSREDFVEYLVQQTMEHKEGIDWYHQYSVRDRELKRIKGILSSDYHNNKELNHAEHMASLERKVKVQAREITNMREKAEVFNEQLYATGLIVNCTGCEAGKPFEGENLTEEKVQQVELLAKRLRTWFNNHKGRMERNELRA